MVSGVAARRAPAGPGHRAFQVASRCASAGKSPPARSCPKPPDAVIQGDRRQHPSSSWEGCRWLSRRGLSRMSCGSCSSRCCRRSSGAFAIPVAGASTTDWHCRGSCLCCTPGSLGSICRSSSALARASPVARVGGRGALPRVQAADHRWRQQRPEFTGSDNLDFSRVPTILREPFRFSTHKTEGVSA